MEVWEQISLFPINITSLLLQPVHPPGEGFILLIFKQPLLGEFWSPDHSKKHRKNSRYTSVYSVTLLSHGHSLHRFYFTHASPVRTVCVPTCPFAFTFWCWCTPILNFHCLFTWCWTSRCARLHRWLSKLGLNCSGKAVHYGFSCFFMLYTLRNYFLCTLFVTAYNI